MLGIIIVDYHGSEKTIEYIKKEFPKIKTPWKAVIVNNCASEESNKKFHQELGADIISENNSYNKKNNIFVLPSSENLGYARGNNLGANFLITEYQCNFLLFTNNDIEFKDDNVIEQLIKKVSSNNSIGMIGPEIVGLNGKRQSPEPYIPIEYRFLIPYILTPFISKKIKSKLFGFDYSDNAREGKHFRIMGSFFLMPTSAFLAINGMDPNTFLYAEEMILSKRLERIGKSVYFDPSVCVIHAHGASTKKAFSNYKMRLIQAKSEYYYYTKYCNVPTIKAYILFYFYKSYLKILSWLRKS